MDNFTITTTVTYRPFRVPPRCRKPRQVEETFTMTTDIPSLTSAEAPVACTFDENELLSHSIDRPGAGLRTYNGSFYTLFRDITAGSAHFPAEQERDSWAAEREEAEKEVTDRIGKMIVIDGKVWTSIGEPYYSVTTYGTGHNHGGTGISLNFQYEGVELNSHDYAATELEAAIQGAVEVATRRGDTRYFDHVRRFKGVNVLVPEAFRIVPSHMRKASKEAEARVIAGTVISALAGAFTREDLREARSALKELDDMMYTHGLETVGR